MTSAVAAKLFGATSTVGRRRPKRSRRCVAGGPTGRAWPWAVIAVLCVAAVSSACRTADQPSDARSDTLEAAQVPAAPVPVTAAEPLSAALQAATARANEARAVSADEIGAWRSIHRVNESRYDAVIVEAATHYSLPPALVKAVVAVESSFDAAAISPAGAQGLMQLMPATASRVHVRDVFDPVDNVYGGARYLRILANRMQGDLRHTLAAYNAGPEAVEAAGGVPDIAETRNYVRRVLALYRHYLAHWRIDSP